MNIRRFAGALCVAVIATRASAQGARLLRCVAGTSVSCLAVDVPVRIGQLSQEVTIGGQDVRVIGALQSTKNTTLYGLLAAESSDRLARMPMRGMIEGLRDEHAVSWQWKPPLIAHVGFSGVADTLGMLPGVRQALGSSSPLLSVRLVVVSMILVLVTVLCTTVPRLTWGDPAPVATPRRSAAPTATADMGVVERHPRSADDITLQTARRTALDR